MPLPARPTVAAVTAAACLAAGAVLAVRATGGAAASARARLDAVADLPAAPRDARARWLAPERALRGWLADPGTPPAVRRAAARRLDRLGAWTWSARDPGILHRWLREAAADAATLDGGDLGLVAARLTDLPGDPGVRGSLARDTVAAWLAATRAMPRRDAASVRAALIGRLGRGIPPRLAEPGLVPADVRTRRLRHLALEGVEAGLDEELAALAAADAPSPAPVADALLVRLATVRPAAVLAPDTAALDRLHDAATPAGRALALATVARRRAVHGGPAAAAAEAALARLDETVPGDADVAARLRRSLAPVPKPASVQAAGGREAGLRAAIAAWRRGGGHAGTASRGVLDPLDALLDDPAVPPALAALLAARDVPDDGVLPLAEAWIRSLDDRRKRAGAVLVAASPAAAAAAPLLARAHAAEDRGDVRLVQRLALRAAGADPGPGPGDRALLDRAAPTIRAGAALLAGLGGDAAALRILTRVPDGFDAADAALREAAIGRLVPEWAAAVGPLAGGPGAVTLQLDRLEARRLRAGPRLRFEPDGRRFTVATPR